MFLLREQFLLGHEQRRLLLADISSTLVYLEAIHNFVEVLNEHFHNVCELDLVFGFFKARNISISYTLK